MRSFHELHTADLRKLPVAELDKQYPAFSETKVRYRVQQLANDP